MISYAITDPGYLNLQNSSNTISYLQKLEKADWVLFRDKQTLDYTADAKNFLQYAVNARFKVLLHQDYKLAYKLKAWGVHLTSNQFNDIPKAKALNLYTIVSTHSLQEIEKAKSLGADAVTLSPIFKTPNKGKPKGLKPLSKAVKIGGIKIIALGGIITKEHIQAINSSGAFGFASIRYFVNHV